MSRNKNVHVTFDNSDGKQQTLLGDNATHHTTGTIFQSTNGTEEDVVVSLKEENIDACDQEREDKINFGTYKIPPIRSRAQPPPFPEFSDKYLIC